MNHEDRDDELACLAQRAVDAMGVNSDRPTVSKILEHSIAQACIEIEAVERVLDRDSTELGELTYIIAGVRQRLTMAQHSASFLATVLGKVSQ